MNIAATNTDPELFAKLGYCLFPNVLSAPEARQTRRLLDEALAAPSSPGRLGYVGEPHASDRRWLDLCRHPRVLDAVESILGPDIILVFSSMFVKLPNSPIKVGWHQDNTYWPSVHGTDVVTLWLAMDDADSANGAMRAIPGSHRNWRELETVPAAEDEMLSKNVDVTPEVQESAITLEMQAGSLSIHDSFLVHGSEGNGSDRRRAGYTIRYCNPNTAWIDMDLHPHPVFVVRGQAGERGSRYTNMLPGITLGDGDL
jgi:ectoine hydroxylase-related dioxygenase (phytanoyl-CoA dioxygenase family)